MLTTNGNYLVESQGNGFAYTITEVKTGIDLFVQGDDAIATEEDTNNFECEPAIDCYF